MNSIFKEIKYWIDNNYKYAMIWAMLIELLLLMWIAWRA